MSTSTSSVRRPFLGGWHLVLAIVALSATRDLWAPDEPRYAEIAKECWDRGEFLVLHLCGDVYSDKPPLVYWLAGLCGRIGGWSELALRVPSILATVGSALLVARLARRLVGEIAGAWAPLFYLGTAMVLEIGGRLQLDPLLAFFCLAAIERLWTSGGDARSRTRRVIAAGIFTGIAALAKGPPAWIHVGFALLATPFVPKSARLELRFRMRDWILLVVLAVLPVAAWAGLASWREPSLFKALFFGQHVGRVLDGTQHAGPIWDHLTGILALLLPWMPLVVVGIAISVRDFVAARRNTSACVEGDDVGAFGTSRVLIWFVLVFVFFSIIPPKRALYLLPIYPATALFASMAFQRALRERRGISAAAWISTSVVLAAGLGLFIAPHFVAVAEPYASALVPSAAVLTLAGATSAWMLRGGRFAAWADAIAIGFTLTILAACVFVIPAVNAVKSARSFAAVVAARPEKPARIPCIGVQPEGFRFYSGVPAVRAQFEDVLHELDVEGAQFLALFGELEFNSIAADVRARMHVVEHQQVGAREVLLVGQSH